MTLDEQKRIASYALRVMRMIDGLSPEMKAAVIPVCHALILAEFAQRNEQRAKAQLLPEDEP